MELKNDDPDKYAKERSASVKWKSDVLEIRKDDDVKRLDGKDTPKRNLDGNLDGYLDGDQKERCKECDQTFEKDGDFFLPKY